MNMPPLLFDRSGNDDSRGSPKCGRFDRRLWAAFGETIVVARRGPIRWMRPVKELDNPEPIGLAVGALMKISICKLRLGHATRPVESAV